MEILSVTIAAVIASIAWLYQKAWERQERRVDRYRKIIDRLPAFTEGNLDPTEINNAIKEVHRLWLFAPDPVVEASERILDIAEGSAKKDQNVVGECIIAMRRDASFSAALIPRFWTTRLTPNRFKIRSANRTPRANP